MTLMNLELELLTDSNQQTSAS